MQAKSSYLAATAASVLLSGLLAGPSFAQTQPAAPAQQAEAPAPAKEAAAPAKDAAPAPAQAGEVSPPAEAGAPAQPATPSKPAEAQAPATDAAAAPADAASAPADAGAPAKEAAPAQADASAPAKADAPAEPAKPAADKDLMGLDVFGSEGQQIGKVSKVNRTDGKLSSIVIQSKGFLGFFKKTYEVPADAIKTKAGRIDLSITSERAAQQKK